MRSCIRNAQNAAQRIKHALQMFVLLPQFLSNNRERECYHQHLRSELIKDQGGKIHWPRLKGR